MMNEEECIRAINFLSLSADCGEDFKAIAVLEQLINEHFDPQPYKFEELKPNMWIWDDKLEFEGFRIIKIEKILTEKECCYLYHDKNKKVFIDNMTNHAREFEENRFYPVTKVIQY